MYIYNHVYIYIYTPIHIHLVVHMFPICFQKPQGSPSLRLFIQPIASCNVGQSLWTKGALRGIPERDPLGIQGVELYGKDMMTISWGYNMI